ncbi:FAD-dependent oxidoreductase [Candidatus Berkiella aquae]|uniref:FAD-binding protein n=1 Tax=Candidatus Berkiella aquae TaxID=295108 RepID=A0A0Q9YZY1_9GAMM|nr:FAD-dependent oxidoreductase [Candidatus Berkiella aquae]MCS5712077.1 FAD-binding protein [Candidatus Berkiella aquae]
MESKQLIQSDVIIAGAGIAGLIAALMLLEQGKKIVLLERGGAENLGGLALEAAGGIHLIDTPEQRRLGINDTPDLAWQDWQSFAHFHPHDIHPKQWAKFYCTHSNDIYAFIKNMGVSFVPRPIWIERGFFVPGNSYPRWHLMWGTGFGLVQQIIKAIHTHPKCDNLTILFQHHVTAIKAEKQGAAFCGINLQTEQLFEARADNIIIATGGISGSDLSTIRRHWSLDDPPLPSHLLNGAHLYGDGQLHDEVVNIGGKVSRLQYHWIYPAGVHHPENRKPHDGISLLPAAHSLWFNAQGKRIGPPPLLIGTNMMEITYAILREPGQYSWSILNYKIATKELIVSLSRYFSAVRDKRKLKFIRNLLWGDQHRINLLIEEAPQDVLLANSLSELLNKMQAQSLYGFELDKENISREIDAFDSQIKRGIAWQTDDQLRRIEHYRHYLVERLRLCRNQPIIDPKALPLMAIRQFPITRKSLGGIETDLHCRVIHQDGEAFPHLYAIGEAAGFGGGGMNGQYALEGTFLGGCILTALQCAKSLA